MEGDEVEEVSSSQIRGLAQSWAFGDWGGGTVPSTGGQHAPSRQSSSIGPFYKPLPCRCQISPVCVCVCARVRRGHIWGCFLWLLPSLSRRKRAFHLLPHVKQGPVEPRTGLLVAARPLSPAPPSLSCTISSQILPSYPTLPRLLPLVPPTLIPGALSPGVRMTSVLTHSFSYEPQPGLVGLPVVPVLYPPASLDHPDRYLLPQVWGLLRCSVPPLRNRLSFPVTQLGSEAAVMLWPSLRLFPAQFPAPSLVAHPTPA